jgi:hypothetical protein
MQPTNNYFLAQNVLGRTIGSRGRLMKHGHILLVCGAQSSFSSHSSEDSAGASAYTSSNISRISPNNVAARAAIFMFQTFFIAESPFFDFVGPFSKSSDWIL